MVQLASELTATADFSTPLDRLMRTYFLPITDGVGLNQCNQHWHDQRTGVGTGGENLDLAGVLVNGLGQTATFARIKLICVFAALANSGNVQVGGHATLAFINWVASATDIINVRPGGLFLLAAPDATGYAVTAGTGDLLTVKASSGTVSYDIVLVGGAT